jgi:hypothetical protein
LRALRRLRAFWVPILTRTRQEKPLDWPSGHSLMQCSLDRLRTIAFHKLRLDANWSRPSPISGSVTSINVGAQNLVAVVSATDIIVVHCSHERRLVCYDTENRQQTFQFDMPGHSCIDFSAPCQIPGQFTIAIGIYWYGAARIYILIVEC